MPSGLFRKENDHWVFSGPTPASFQGYDKDHSKLLVDYIFLLTPDEQRKVAGAMGRAKPTAKLQTPKRIQTANALGVPRPAGGGGSR